jgi:hypothetical protein
VGVILGSSSSRRNKIESLYEEGLIKIFELEGRGRKGRI